MLISFEVLLICFAITLSSCEYSIYVVTDKSSNWFRTCRLAVNNYRNITASSSHVKPPSFQHPKSFKTVIDLCTNFFWVSVNVWYSEHLANDLQSNQLAGQPQQAWIDPKLDWISPEGIWTAAHLTRTSQSWKYTNYTNKLNVGSPSERSLKKWPIHKIVRLNCFVVQT